MSCSEQTYTIGAEITCEGDFRRTSDNALFDPGAVFFKYRDPSGNEETYQFGVDVELGQYSTGKYYAKVTGDEAGTWFYKFYSTGSGQAAAEGSFTVAASNFS